MDEFVTALRGRRLQLGLSQAGLARRMSMSRSAVSKLEAELCSPTLYTLRRWTQALGWDIHLAPALDRRGGRGRPVTARCGSISAAKRHYHRGEPLDDACRAAQRTYDRERARARRVA